LVPPAVRAVLPPTMVCCFWALSLFDLYHPAAEYKIGMERLLSAIERGEQQRLAIVAAAGREKKRCDGLHAALQLEERWHVKHTNAIRAKLKSCRESLFPQGPDAREAVDAVLSALVRPRMSTGPEEALFASKFFDRMHALSLPGPTSPYFHTATYFRRVVRSVIQSIRVRFRGS
ncbi:unnamed protein product, partial [Phaeothamnion confervicola]